MLRLRYFIVPLLSAFAVLLLSIAGCRKTPKECNNHIPLHPMAYDYFVFKPGSYWVYKEESSGAIDSVWVIGIHEEDYWAYRELGTKDCPCFKSIGITHRHSFINNLDEHLGISAIISKNNTINASEVSINGTFDSTYLDEIRFHDVFDPSRYNTTTGKGLGRVTMLDSFTTNNQTYYQVFKLKYPKYYRTVDWVVELYQAKHIGVIQFTDYQYRTWELIRYKVLQ